MSYVFEQVTVRKWEVTGVYKNYMIASELGALQRVITKCEICNSAIKPTDYINLAYVKGRKNHLICVKCTEEAEANGVTVTQRRTEPQVPLTFD